MRLGKEVQESWFWGDERVGSDGMEVDTEGEPFRVKRLPQGSREMASLHGAGMALSDRIEVAEVEEVWTSTGAIAG